MQPDEPGLQPHPERKRRGRYRKQLEEAEKTEEAKIPAYSSLVLAVVVLTLGFTAYQNHKKMNEMENTLAQMNQVHIVTEMPETEKTADSGIVVENIAGSIENRRRQNRRMNTVRRQRRNSFKQMERRRRRHPHRMKRQGYRQERNCQE